MTTTTRTTRSARSTITEAEAQALLQRITQLTNRMTDLIRRLDQVERDAALLAADQGATQ